MGHALVLTQDVYAAKELLQDLSVYVFGNVEYYEDKTDAELGKLFYAKIVYLNTDRIRWNRRHAYSEIPMNYKSEVENDAWHNMRKKEVLNALQNLAGKKQKLCFRLRLDGLSNKDIEQLTGFKTNNVLLHVDQAKKHIRKQLQL